jgi:hypothetical protein
MENNSKKNSLWTSLFNRKKERNKEETTIKKTEIKETKFPDEKFSTLYNLEFSYFLNYIVKQNSEEILKQCNYKISDFVTKHAYDPIQDVTGIHRWLDGLSKDENIYNLNSKTTEVREKTHEIFSRKIKSLIDSEYFFNCEVTNDIAEAVFLRNSITAYVNLIQKQLGL